MCSRLVLCWVVFIFLGSPITSDSCSSHLSCSRSSSHARLVSATDFWVCAAHARVLVLPPVTTSGQALRVGFPFAEHATRSALARFSSACFVPQPATVFSSLHPAGPRSYAPKSCLCSREAFGLRSSVLTSLAVCSMSVQIFYFSGSFCVECM
jgi:hypothetical protein